MKLENQVTSLELSKKLKELGVKQESLFYYQGSKDEIQKEKGYSLDFKMPYQSQEVVNISAFTVAELGEMLPMYIENVDVDKLLGLKSKNKTIDAELVFTKFRNNDWTYYYMEHKTHGICINNSSTNCGKTEADARAKMLIYLIENKLI